MIAALKSAAIGIAFVLAGAAVYEPAEVGVTPPPAAPGVVASTDATDVCGYVGGLSYSKRHRHTTPEMKAEVRRRDGITGRFTGEIDHRLPLALGGADDVRNLWAEPPPPAVWNYHLKDELEVVVWHAVCRSHTMSLAEGQAIFLAPDWRVGFCRLVGGRECPR